MSDPTSKVLSLAQFIHQVTPQYLSSGAKSKRDKDDEDEGSSPALLSYTDNKA